MNSLPLVSIGIPLYNEEYGVIKTINSALDQSYENIEIIVSDNASTDDSWNIVFDTYSNNPKIQLFRQLENVGPNSNFEFVMNKAKGDFFMWLGGHDLIHPEYISMAVEEHSKNPNSSLVYFQHQLLDYQYNFIETPMLPSINSGKLSVHDRAIKVYQSLNYCTHIHGLWRTKLRDKIKFIYYVGPDHLILFVFAIYGTIHEINKKYYYRMLNRKENDSQSIIRYKSYGYKVIDNDILYTLFHGHADYLFKNKHFIILLKISWLNANYFKKYLLLKLNLKKI